MSGTQVCEECGEPEYGPFPVQHGCENCGSQGEIISIEDFNARQIVSLQSFLRGLLGDPASLSLSTEEDLPD